MEFLIRVQTNDTPEPTDLYKETLEEGVDQRLDMFNEMHNIVSMLIKATADKDMTLNIFLHEKEEPLE